MICSTELMHSDQEELVITHNRYQGQRSEVEQSSYALNPDADPFIPTAARISSSEENEADSPQEESDKKSLGDVDSEVNDTGAGQDDDANGVAQS